MATSAATTAGSGTMTISPETPDTTGDATSSGGRQSNAVPIAAGVAAGAGTAILLAALAAFGFCVYNRRRARSHLPPSAEFRADALVGYRPTEQSRSATGPTFTRVSMRSDIVRISLLQLTG